MYIVSHDKKVMMKAQILKIEKNFGGRKDAEYALVGTADTKDASPEILGLYSTEEEAIDELQRIAAALAARDTVYIIE